MATSDQEATPQTGRTMSRRTKAILYGIMAVISLAGLADATYLTVTHLTGDNLVCGESAGCSAVLGSAYASFAGIPTAGFGVMAYFAAFSLAILATFGYARARVFLILLVTGMFIASLGFLYLQAFVLHAFCPYCLLSAALTFFLAGLLVASPPAR